MHSTMFRYIDGLLAPRTARMTEMSALEIGCHADHLALLNLPVLRDATTKVGIDLDGPFTVGDIHVLKGDANSMTCFSDSTFDVVLCNAVLEHDKFFWKTLGEIKRVARPGGVIVIGVPGYISDDHRGCIGRVQRFLLRHRRIARCLPQSLVDNVCYGTVTFRVHDYPGDFYRFSEQAVREVFLDGLVNTEVHVLMTPPRIIGVGEVERPRRGPSAPHDEA